MSAPGGILALDVALRVGWAYGIPSMRVPLCGVWTLPGAADAGRCYAALGNTLSDALDLHKPRLVILEAPLVREDRSARLLLGLCAHVESTCWRYEVRCTEQHSGTVRKAVIGRGNFPKGQAKAAVLAYCAEQGWRVPDDNAADAAVLWRFACLQQPAGRVAA